MTGMQSRMLDGRRTKRGRRWGTCQEWGCFSYLTIEDQRLLRNISFTQLLSAMRETKNDVLRLKSPSESLERLVRNRSEKQRRQRWANLPKHTLENPLL